MKKSVKIFKKIAWNGGKGFLEWPRGFIGGWPNDHVWPRWGEGGQNFRKSDHMVYGCSLIEIKFRNTSSVFRSIIVDFFCKKVHIFFPVSFFPQPTVSIYVPKFVECQLNLENQSTSVEIWPHYLRLHLVGSIRLNSWHIKKEFSRWFFFLQSQLLVQICVWLVFGRHRRSWRWHMHIKRYVRVESS